MNVDLSSCRWESEDKGTSVAVVTGEVLQQLPDVP